MVKHPIDALRTFFGVFESGPRVHEFRKVLAIAEKKYGKGSQAALIEALLQSRDVTVNFTRAGIISSALNGAIPFFNPRIQGASKFYRTFVGAPVATSFKASARAFMWLTIPSLLLWWMVKDDDEWQELPDWRKWGFWNIPLKWFGAEGGFLSIPLPFELGYVFGSVPAAAMDSMYRKDPKGVQDAMFMAFMSFLPGSPAELIPAAVRPIIEDVTNYNAFRGREIVSPYDADRKLPQDRYNQWTTETAKEIGKLLGVSPAKVENYLSGYTGGLGLRLVQQGETWAGIRGSGREKTAADTPVVGTLFTRDPFGRGESLDRLYDRRDELQQLKTSKQATQEQIRELARIENAVEIVGNFRKLINEGVIDESLANKQITNAARKALGLAPLEGVEPLTREQWRAIHEKRRDKRMAAKP
jgi:hypothetical protein